MKLATKTTLTAAFVLASLGSAHAAHAGGDSNQAPSPAAMNADEKLDAAGVGSAAGIKRAAGRNGDGVVSADEQRRYDAAGTKKHGAHHDQPMKHGETMPTTGTGVSERPGTVLPQGTQGEPMNTIRQ